MKRTRALGVLLAGCAVMFAGCTAEKVDPDFHQPTNRPGDAKVTTEFDPSFATYNSASAIIFPDYRLNIGDELEIIYHVRTGVTADKYRLKVQDMISIRFPFQEELNQDVSVQSDGTIRALLVGEVQVVERGHRGLSPYHFRQLEPDGAWVRYDADTGTWVPYGVTLEQGIEGRWLRIDPATGRRVPLERDLEYDRTGQLIHPCIVDAVTSMDRSERFEYDPIHQRWKARSAVVDQRGLTARELEETLRREYGRYLKDPELTVRIEQASIKIEELKRAITTAPRGQSRLVPIKPDGTIDLPFIGEILAYGKTVQQLKTDVERAYAWVDLPEISVTVQINKWAPIRVFVLGEVKTPGLLQLPTQMTLLQAIAAAGGVNTRAERREVMVVRRRGLPVPQATVVDTTALVSKRKTDKAGEVPDFSSMRHDFYLADGDVVYVPTTALAAAGDWTEAVFARIIRNIIPYNFYTGLNFNYEVHAEPVEFKNSGPNIPPIQIVPPAGP